MKTLIILGFWMTAGLAAASDQNHLALSIPFGVEGAYSSAKAHVFVDKEQLAPRCPCYRFSFLLDDRVNTEVPPIERVMVWLTEVNGNEVLYSPRVMDLEKIAAHPLSPRKTEQVIYRLGTTPEGGLVDMRAKFVAMRRNCLDPAEPTCSEYVIEIQGEFTGGQLQTLAPVKAADLLGLEGDDR